MRRLAIGVLVIAAGTARAQPAKLDEADALFREGRELARQGKADEACALFARSYELEPAPGTAVNLADCLERAGQLGRAWAMFDEVARGSQTVQSRARLARARADALIGKLATVIVTVTEPATPGLAVRLGDRTLAAAAELRAVIEPGDVPLIATAPGRRPSGRTLHAVAGATLEVTIPALPAPATLRPDELGEPGEPTRRRRSRVYLAAGLGTLGVAGLGGAVAAAIVARRDYDAAFAHGCARTPGGVVCLAGTDGKARIDAAGRRADLATGLAIGGAVAAGVAAVVWLTAPRETLPLVPIAGARELGVALVGRF